jgi:hypothetical protein
MIAAACSPSVEYLSVAVELCGATQGPVPFSAGRYRAISRHPGKHGANIEAAGSRPI